MINALRKLSHSNTGRKCPARATQNEANSAVYKCERKKTLDVSENANFGNMEMAFVSDFFFRLYVFAFTRTTQTFVEFVDED